MHYQAKHIIMSDLTKSFIEEAALLSSEARRDVSIAAKFNRSSPSFFSKCPNDSAAADLDDFLDALRDINKPSAHL